MSINSFLSSSLTVNLGNRLEEGSNFRFAYELGP
jgi:hypothetical protein